MTSRIVKTQAELDAALADKGVGWIEIRSAAGVWLEVVDSGSSMVRAYGSSTVRAYGSSTVTAYGSSTVTACDSSTVTAYDSSTVTAYDSSTVTAYGSSTVTAYDSSTVTAYDSSTVTAYGSSTVTAYDSSTVTATPKVAIHLFNANATVTGGVVIDVSKPITTGAEWCEYHGVKVTRAGIATVFKAVDDRWTTSRGFDYSPGKKPKAPDWSDDMSCGGGLHFSPSPTQALAYNGTATRFVAVGVKVADIRPIPGGTAKCKAPAVVRGCVEVDLDGKAVR